MRRKQRRCKKGHVFTTKNTILIKSKGKKYSACRACRAEHTRFRYKTDPEFKARIIKAALKFYYKKKGEKQNGLAEVPR